MRKIVTSYEEIAEQIRANISPFGTLVVTNGCFDIFHRGHLELLRHCRRLAGPSGKVVVCLNDDESVRRLKGMSRPINGMDDRAEMLVSNRFVDHVVSFSEDTPLELIKALRPSLIVKSDEYAMADVVGGDLFPVHLVPHDKHFSTTSLIERMRRE